MRVMVSLVLVLATQSAIADAPKPIVGRVVKVELVGGTSVATITVGSDDGVQKAWQACVVPQGSETCIANGEATILRVNKHETIVKTKLALTAITSSPFVRLAPR